MVNIGNDWDELLAAEWDKPYYLGLREFLREEYSRETVYPPAGDIFNSLKMTPYSSVRVVILGQDPYHEPGQAQGLAFSVPYDVQMPPSLVNILRELRDDIGEDAAAGIEQAGTAQKRVAGADGNEGLSGVLVPWTRQGVLLLNTCLTVQAHKAGSHRGKGWEQFTDTVIGLLAERQEPMVFILWGAHARAKKDLIVRAQMDAGQPDGSGTLRHLIIEAPHPSPLSAHRGFFGGRYFSRCNYFLEDSGTDPVDWRL